MSILALSNRLTTVITETGNNFGWLDRWLDTVADKLNARKLRQLEGEISQLEAMQKDAQARERTLTAHMREMKVDIDRLQQHRSFRGEDLATLGLSYLIRNLLTEEEHGRYHDLRARTHRDLEHLAQRGRQLKFKIDSLQQHLEAARSQANPSIWARVIRWVLALKNTLLGILNCITGNIMEAISNWSAVIKAVPQLARA